MFIAVSKFQGAKIHMKNVKEEPGKLGLNLFLKVAPLLLL